MCGFWIDERVEELAEDAKGRRRNKREESKN